MSDWFRLLRDRSLRWYWLGRSLSLIAGAVSLVAAPVVVYQLTSSALWVSVLVAGHGVPYLVLGSVAGAVADRTDRSRVLRTCELVTSLATVTVPAAAAVGTLTAGHVVVAVTVARAAFVFADAANFGLVPALAPPGRLAAVTAMLFATSSVVEMVGPGLVGAVLAVLPASHAMFAGSVASALALTCFQLGRLPQGSARRGAPGRQLYQDVLEGARWVASHPRIRSTVVLGATVTAGQGLFISQLVPWSAERLGVGVGSSVTGSLFMAWAAGGLIATALVPAATARLGEPAVAMGGMWMAATGAVSCMFAMAPQIAIVTILVWGAGFLVVVLSTVVWRQLATPDGLRSRVNTAARMVAFGIGYPLGGLLGGWVSTIAGTHVALGTAGVVTASVALVVSRTWRRR